MKREYVIFGYPGCYVDMESNSNEIHFVFVHPKFRNQGIGTRLLKRVIKDADREGVNLSLTPCPCGIYRGSKKVQDEKIHVDLNRLRKWYRAFGFKRTQRKNHFGQVYERKFKTVRPFRSRL